MADAAGHRDPLAARAGDGMSHDPCQAVYDALDQRDRAPRGPAHKFTALCPAHEDRSPSLSVCEGIDRRAVLHCFAGCETDTIIRELGLRWTDLFPDGHRHAPRTRQAKVTTERPVVSVLIALYAAGVGYRLTASPRLFVADWCPRCEHRALWIHDYRDRVRLSCWTSGCDSDEILTRLEQLVTEGVDRVAA
jgi:hypothetical protein